MADLRSAPVRGRSIRPSDLLFGGDPAVAAGDQALRADTLTEVILTIFTNLPALNVAQQVAVRSAFDSASADALAALTARVAALEAAQPPVPGTHARYAVLSAVAATPTEADFLGGATSENTEIQVPAFAMAMYLHFADIHAALSDIREQGSAFSSRQFFSDPPTALEINGVDHYVYSSAAALNPYAQAQIWELTP